MRRRDECGRGLDRREHLVSDLEECCEEHLPRADWRARAVEWRAIFLGLVQDREPQNPTQGDIFPRLGLKLSPPKSAVRTLVLSNSLSRKSKQARPFGSLQQALIVLPITLKKRDGETGLYRECQRGPSSGCTVSASVRAMRAFPSENSATFITLFVRSEGNRRLKRLWITVSEAPRI